MKKLSVISGGSSGLGLEMAKLLARQGKNVLIIARGHDRLAAAARIIKEQSSSEISFLQCDIASEHDVIGTGNFIKDQGYEVEYLFNNAGQGLFAPAVTTDAGMVDRIFGPNLKGMILLTTEILRITPEDSELTVVNIMSTSAQLGRAEETIYCAAKFGARGYTEALRTEFKGKKRNFIAVYPGGMRTEFWNLTGQSRNLTDYMDPAEVAVKIVDAVTGTTRLIVSDITINRK